MGAFALSHQYFPLEGSGEVARSRRVLVVDDDPDIRHAMGRVLRRAGYQTLAAGDATEALTLLADTVVDVVVADEHMPQVLGRVLLHLLADLYPNVGRILLSGSVDAASMRQAAQHGRAHASIAKPCLPKTILEAVEAALQPDSPTLAVLVDPGGPAGNGPDYAATARGEVR